MSDLPFREAHRCWKATGDPADWLRFLQERIRHGELPANTLEKLLALGHPIARAAVGRATVPARSRDSRVTAFLRALADTIVWCELGPASEDLRSPALALPGLRNRNKSPGYGNRAELGPHVPEVVERRSRAIDPDLWPAGAGARSLLSGALYAYEWDKTEVDGASEALSHEFYDGYDVPPWDTWLLDTGRHLVFWVPPGRRSDALEGALVNVQDLIHGVSEPIDGRILPLEDPLGTAILELARE